MTPNCYICDSKEDLKDLDVKNSKEKICSECAFKGVQGAKKMVSNDKLEQTFEKFIKDMKDNSLKEGKKASLKKWRYILKNIDKINWAKDAWNEIWYRCGLCKSNNSYCNDCQLSPHCTGNFNFIKPKEPLRKIADRGAGNKKPYKKDIKAFIKLIEKIKVR